MRHLFAALPVLTLSMCATVQEPIVPRSLLTCAEQPMSPAGDTAATDETGGHFVINLALAGDDCRSKLGRVGRILYPETGT